MGIIGMISDAGTYFADRFNALGKSYADAWTKNLPDAAMGWWSGVTTMASSVTGGDGDFAKGLRLFADSSLGVTTSLLQGTVGGALEAPVLHEGVWALDKAYRYGVARPISWVYVNQADATLKADDARKHGDDPTLAYLGEFLNKDRWVGDRGMWSDQIGKVTPGQAIIWAAGGEVGQLNPGNSKDPVAWLRDHDPRTPEGQAKFNSPESEFLLKYASGTIDLLANAYGDPGHGLSVVTKAGKAKFIDHVATPAYKEKGLIDKEITSKHQEAVYQLAIKTPIPERFRDRAFPNAPLGGTAAVVLHAAAQVSREVFNDAYVVARGLDGLFDENKVGAWQRLVDMSPETASQMARIFANWNIGEDSLAIGKNPLATGAMASMALSDAQAFKASLKLREGIWGEFPGSLAMTAQPKVRLTSELRTGVHTWAMGLSTIDIGRPFAKAVQTVLPSQGFTSMLDLEDPSILGLKQFKANLERSGMIADKVERWTSQYAGKTNRAGRGFVWQNAHAAAIRDIAERHNLDPQTIENAMPEIMRYGDASAAIVAKQRVYRSSQASRVGAALVAKGAKSEAKWIRDLHANLTKEERMGHFGMTEVAISDYDGKTHSIEVPDTEKLPSQGAAIDKALESTQIERIQPTFDYRALDGQLKWWKLMHRPEPGIKGLALSKIAKTHAAWDAMITSSDLAMMVWKTSTLLRPAQTPRNLADDILRRMIQFGKLPLMMSAATGTKRAIQNWTKPDGRAHLVHEVIKEQVASRKANRDTVIDATAGEHAAAPNNPPPISATNPPKDLGQAWIDGLLGWDSFFKLTDQWIAHATLYQNVDGAVSSLYNQYHQKSFGPLPPGITERKTDQASELRDFKRRLLMYYYDRAGREVAFLSDRRFPGKPAEPEVLKAPGVWPKAAVAAVPPDPKYTSVDIRTSWIEKLRDDHRASREGDNPYRPGELLIDPFTGKKPTWHGSADDPLEGGTIFAPQNLNNPIKKDGDVSLPASKSLEIYILNHLDDLMRPDAALWMAVDPSGNVRMGVAKPKAKPGEDLPPVKVSAAKQLRDFKMNGIMDSGHEQIRVTTNTGQYMFDGPRSGPEGAKWQDRISSTKSGAEYLLVGDVSQANLLDQMGGWGMAQPHERGYAPSWERDVNQQLAGDKVARMFLEGASETDVIRWVERTPDGTAYIYNAKHLGTNHVDLVRQIKGDVDTYVPPQDSKAGKMLRKAVLESKATREMLDAVIPDRSQQPEVHGASLQYLLGKGAVFDMMTRGIRQAQKILSDIPTDKASRFPFFDEAYRRHLNDLMKMADQDARLQGSMIPAEALHRIDRQAKERALYDTKYRLYDVAQMNDIARLTRFVVPFSSAIMDSYLKYGRLIRENPALVLQGLYYWEMFDRNSQVQDENGYLLEKETNAAGAVDNWYAVDPKTGVKTLVDPTKVGKDRYVQFRLPSSMGHLVGKTFFGVDMQPVMAINKKSFNVFVDLPSAGPMVAVPVNEFALSNPEFGESEVIKQFVLPFGPSTSRGKVFLPSTVRTAWDLFASSDGLKAEAQAKSIFQAELIAYNRGERQNPPSFAEVRQRAAMLKGLRFATAFISPLSFQTTSPYEPYLDAYRQLAAVDPQGADEAFQARYGDEFYAVAMTVTRNNASIRATLNSQASFNKHKDLIAQYPELAGLIVGAEGAGAFSKAVYETQKETPMRPGGGQTIREAMSLEDSVTELEKRRVWQEYSKMQDLLTADMADKGLTSLRGKRGAELAKVRDAFIEANKYWVDPVTDKQVISPWYKDFSTVDHNAMDNRIDALWQIVQDPTMQKRDDIRGLIDYLHLREQIQGEMSTRKLKTLTSQKAAPLAEAWQLGAFNIREANPAFGALWNRWLSRDSELPLTGKAVA